MLHKMQEVHIIDIQVHLVINRELSTHINMKPQHLNTRTWYGCAFTVHGSDWS